MTYFEKQFERTTWLQVIILVVEEYFTTGSSAVPGTLVSRTAASAVIRVANEMHIAEGVLGDGGSREFGAIFLPRPSGWGLDRSCPFRYGVRPSDFEGS